MVNVILHGAYCAIIAPDGELMSVNWAGVYIGLISSTESKVTPSVEYALQIGIYASACAKVRVTRTSDGIKPLSPP